MRFPRIPPMLDWTNRRPGDRRFLFLVPLTGAATGFAPAVVAAIGYMRKPYWL